MSLLNHVPFVPRINTCLRALNYYMPTCPYFSGAYVLSFLTFWRAYNHSQNILRLTSIPCIAVFLWIICISSHQRCSSRKGVLRNSVKLTGKHLCLSLHFKKVASLSPATLLKKKLWGWCFPMNFAEFLRTPFFTEHLWATASVFDLSFHSISQNKPLLL